MRYDSSISKKYSTLCQRRQWFLSRAWEGAEVTIPFILPRNYTLDQDLPTPYQGIGARGVNNLSAKLLLTLFPPNSPFFKFQIDDFTLEELQAQRAPVEEGHACPSQRMPASPYNYRQCPSSC